MRQVISAGLLVALLGHAFAAAEVADSGAARSPAAQQPPYEVIRSGAAYCAPRVLYFMARYRGVETTLADVVRACKTDDAGDTTLLNLQQAALDLGLHPTCVECSKEELLACNGPAVLCVEPSQRMTGQDAAESTKRVHFIGVIRREGDRWRVIDPSLSLEPRWVDSESLTQRFSGYLVLLDVSRSDSTSYLKSVGVGTAAGVSLVALMALAYVRSRRRPVVFVESNHDISPKG